MSLDPSPYYHHHSQKGPKSENPPQHISNLVFEQATSSKVGNSRGSQSLSLCGSCLCPPFHNTRRSSSFTLFKPSKSLTLFYYYFTISKNTHYLFLHLMQPLNFLFPFLCSICLSLNQPLKSSLVNTVNL